MGKWETEVGHTCSGTQEIRPNLNGHHNCVTRRRQSTDSEWNLMLEGHRSLSKSGASLNKRHPVPYSPLNHLDKNRQNIDQGGNPPWQTYTESGYAVNCVEIQKCVAPYHTRHQLADRLSYNSLRLSDVAGDIFYLNQLNHSGRPGLPGYLKLKLDLVALEPALWKRLNSLQFGRHKSSSYSYYDLRIDTPFKFKTKDVVVSVIVQSIRTSFRQTSSRLLITVKIAPELVVTWATR